MVDNSLALSAGGSQDVSRRIPAWRIAVCAGLTVLYFFWFTWEGLRAPFFPDEMMNMAWHWELMPWERVYANLLLWRGYYRPMGAVFYVPIFEKFGLNPLPFHVALLGLLLVLVALTYRLARTLGAGPLEAWLAALIVSYDAGLENLYYQAQFIYDLLCAIFYAAALIAYVRARSRPRMRIGDAALYFVLFVCALDSKEMAVTLPVILLAYEWLYRGRDGERIVRRLAIPAASSVMTAVYVYGRVLHGIARDNGYGVRLSMERLIEFQRRQYQTLFLQAGQPELTAVVVMWLVVTYLAWRRNRPLLRYCWIWIVLTPLPIEFLQGRGEATMVIPLLGWASLAAVVAVGLSRRISDGLSDEIGLRRLGRPARHGIVLALLVGAWALVNWHLYSHYVRPRMGQTAVPTAAVIEEFRRLHPVVRPHSTVVFLNDPFVDWDMDFIAELWFRDRTVTIWLNRKTPLTAEQVAGANYLFDWRDGRLVRVR